MLYLLIVLVTLLNVDVYLFIYGSFGIIYTDRMYVGVKVRGLCHMLICMTLVSTFKPSLTRGHAY